LAEDCTSRSQIVGATKRLVVKIGTGVLSDAQGQLDTGRIEHLAEQICQLRSSGYAIAVVSSGAIGAGMAALGMTKRPRATAKLQAAAAVGQSRLMAIYSKCFDTRGYCAAQILLTLDDFEAFNRYLNARRTFAELNKLDAIPVVNENDTISAEEITFGDNDTLAALVASLFEADLLILLSTVDGLYDATGSTVEVVPAVTDEVKQLSWGKVSRGGVGGMESKLQAIRMATDFGEPVVLGNGKTDNVLVRIMRGDNLGTLFMPAARRVAGRKRWLMFGGRTKGKLWIDDGAVGALLKKGKSLLPSGLTKVQGSFAKGDVVSILSSTGDLVAKGSVSFGAGDAAKICGAQTNDIARLLGDDQPEEVVHRDYMVVFHEGRPA